MEARVKTTIEFREASTTAVSPRWGVFVYQDGVLLCPTVSALAELGILEASLAGETSVADVYPEISETGFGYMRVGLRCLASQGWLDLEPTLDPETTILRWTDVGRQVAPYWDRYVTVGRFLSGFSSLTPKAWSLHWDASQCEAFLSSLELACDRWRLGTDLSPHLRALTTTHLDAGMVVPAMLSLRGAGLLVADGPVLPDTEAGHGVGRFLEALGWMDGATGHWTVAGRQARRFAVHYGMAASYLPLLAKLPDLFRGGATVAPAAGDPEWHVHRGLNVIASAAAHKRYFADADGIFLELFDREPIEEQPRFVADMGCGDGSWLVHLHRLITERTLRGRHADRHPLLMVGLDYNAAALEEARRVLDEADVPALLTLGDISDPDQVSATLAARGLAMQDGLHVRAFIDHDRTYIGADPDVAVRGWSSGAYVDRSGRPLDAAAVERDLVAHLQRWTPHVGQHGLVILEAHCVAPRIARQHLGATHSVAFDAYHGYSHQYPVEHSAFLRCCRQAGLQPASYCERRYPASRPFVAVSLNRLLGETQAPIPALRPGACREDTWQPDPDTDLEDGRALHELLYTEADTRYPRLWCSAATGYVVAGALDVIETRLDRAREGDVIRVLDYGAGTGLATIELLKALHERGTEERLERLGVALELHLVDLPSSWFAQGFELLRDCAWTRFHSLRNEEGGFRPLFDVTGRRKVDVLMANMVFHLIPRDALERVAADLAGVLRTGGRLLWNSPDLGPPGRYAVLFHDANRTLRARWLHLLAGERSAASRQPDAEAVDPVHPPHLREAIRRARLGRNAETIRSAQARADRRVLPQANSAEDVEAALASAFRAETELDLQTHEILDEDIVDTLLVPSNQAEFMPEISERSLREEVIRSLMLDEVLPSLRAGLAGTAVGLNVQWTLGRCVTDGA